ncbi:DUF2970 domain-containing protein [Sinimarinibacterium sp. CAU 1509]|uniref:DUF2970 domain-containing protein n=1 Tax=Sinimarinibacterium sp. CAU 1509 TaxID=2562283 RepID=UPI0010AC7E97|nr:DUF2970 domain-containing protein [Sinimarinibacterium sp. CAU 1509]TJY60964.1 DUF2970 domain-containing protein [Sinimarinibacterium sp. CAU 1509]
MKSDDSKQGNQDPAKSDKAPTIWQTFTSVSASFFGVQSSKNRERDFKHGKASHFIVIGILMTIGFILMVWLAVKFALKSAGM